MRQSGAAIVMKFRPPLMRRRWTRCWQKSRAMALDLLPDNHPDVDPSSLFLQITALREAAPATS
jgi:hypothetical protein